MVHKLLIYNISSSLPHHFDSAFLYFAATQLVTMTGATSTKPGVSERFSSPTADVTLRSCDGVIFKAHRVFLSEASSVLGKMVNTSRPNEQRGDNIRPIDLPETEDVVDALLRWIYPYPDKPTVDTWEHLESYLDAACKYGIGVAVAYLYETLKSSRFLTAAPVRAYGAALRLRSAPGALDVAELLLLSRAQIIRTNVDIVHLSADDVGERISGLDILDLINTQAAYRKAVERIINPIYIETCFSCQKSPPEWWRPNALSLAISRFSPAPIFTEAFRNYGIPSPSCSRCGGATPKDRHAKWESELLDLWKTGDYPSILEDWNRVVRRAPIKLVLSKVKRNIAPVGHV
ncbi:hypothetical protein BOTBODRAFT_175784 [Botryobasidium botryosum FD-172 SS1]|uniref:BTB domain-containing protein n=1 Tax=Botryobasidium botryosum (strain FD-172 SS1) TaxID=930990 RepID=A0A067MEN8_BOTB1|nr:hypothetical protein BOTBODRAFT_175784 [Botryobasidium botryosum FD-172 SS1]